jgi:hypothetical protein
MFVPGVIQRTLQFLSYRVFKISSSFCPPPTSRREDFFKFYFFYIIEKHLNLLAKNSKKIFYFSEPFKFHFENSFQKITVFLIFKNSKKNLENLTAMRSID